MRGRNKKEQYSNTAKKHKPHGYRPAVNAEVLALRQAFQSAKTRNQKLALININLRRQVEKFKRMESNWIQEKQKLVHENRRLRKVLGSKYIHAKNVIQRLEGVLEVAESHKAYRKKENEKLQAAFKNTLSEFKLERKRWSLREEKRTIELKEMQEKWQEQEVLIIKKEKLITRYRRELLALAKENLQTGIRMRQNEDAHNQSETEWKTKYEAQEVRLREELANRENKDKEHVTTKTENSVVSLEKKKNK